MTGFTDKLKDSFGKHGKSSHSKKSEAQSSESHTSTVTPVHSPILPSESQYGSQSTGLPSGAQQSPTPYAGGASNTESFEHVSAPKDHHHPPVGPTTPSGPITPSISPRLPLDSLPSSNPGASADSQGIQYETSGSNTSGINPNISGALAGSSTAPGGPTYEPRAQEQRTLPSSGIGHDTSSRLAEATGAPGGATFEPQFSPFNEQGGSHVTQQEQRTSPSSGIGHDTSSRLAGATGAPGGSTFEPQINEQGGSGVGQQGAANSPTFQPQGQRASPDSESHSNEQSAPTSGISPGVSSQLAGSNASPGGSTFEPGTKEHDSSSAGQQRVANPIVADDGAPTGFNRAGGGDSSAEADKASIGGGSVNANTTPTSSPGTGLGSNQPQGYVQQAKETAAPYVAKVQETAGPYVAKVQETAAPYVAKVQETAGPYVAKAQETASPYVAKARDMGTSAVESARPVIASAATQASQAANSAYSTAAAELDARGVNMENTKQKLADAGQVAKDYGTVGQQRAGEYLAQAVDQAKNMDGENKSIVASIFGTVVLVWLAFGFSLMAMLALGVAGTIAALLARFSRKRVSGHSPATSSGIVTPPKHTQTTAPGVGAAPKQSQTPGVETHYPRPSHPDNSLNNAAS